MKKLLLATYEYRTGEEPRRENKTLVAIDSTPTTPDHHDVERAEATFAHWFGKVYPESNLISVSVMPAITELTTFPHLYGDKPEPVIYKTVNGTAYTRDDMSRYADWLWYNDLAPDGSQTIEEWETLGKPTR